MVALSPIRWLHARPHRSDGPAALHAEFDANDFHPALKTDLLILQPTPFCNLDCDYCYLPDRNVKARMSLETAALAARRLTRDDLVGDNLTVVWHAGEPLVMGPAFYDAAINAISEALPPYCEVSHSIQTNATLIDGAWCDLFERHGMHVGVSVDGPAQLHDAHRQTRSGKGTHRLVERGMRLLAKRRIAFHAIAVVTDLTLNQPDAFYDFFMENAVTELGCNFDEAEGVHARSSLADQEASHAAFLARLMERWAETAGAVRIREFERSYRSIMHALPTYEWQGRSFPQNAQVTPFAIVSVAWDGGFSTFSPELLGQRSTEFGDFLLGNVHTGGFIASAGSSRFRQLWNAVLQGTDACARSCSHFNYCGGGAPANKLYENGRLESAETLYCRTMVKRPFDLVLNRLETELEFLHQKVSAGRHAE